MTPGSVIINTTSIQAYDPSPNLLPYAATKSAIVSMTKALSMIGMKQGIRTNAVAPGPVWTPLIPATMPVEKVKTFGQDTLFERAAQPVEIAPIFVFLASNEARFVTGEVYGVTGGQTPLLKPNGSAFVRSIDLLDSMVVTIDGRPSWIRC
jgi:hypothetical protein